MARPARGAGGWWRGVPIPLRLGIELVACFSLVSALKPFIPAVEIVALALVAMGVAHSCGKLQMIRDYPALARVLDWYAPPEGRAAFSRAVGGGGNSLAPSAAKLSPPPPIIKPPDISEFAGIDNVMQQLRGMERTPWILGNTPLSGVIILLVGPRGTGKSDIAHAWAASLQKAGVRKSKHVRLISKTQPGLFTGYGPTTEALQFVREEAEAALDGVLVIDDLDCLVPPTADYRGQEMGDVLLDVARRHPKRLLIVTSGSPSSLAQLDPTRRWVEKFHEEIIRAPTLDDDALYSIFANVAHNNGKQLEAGFDVTFKIRLRDIQTADFANALTIIKLAGKAIAAAGDRPIIMKADLRNIIS